MIFWIGIALLCVVTVAAVAWPLLRANASAGLDGTQSQLAVIRDRQREIDREVAAGRMSESEADEARNALIDNLARDLPDGQSGQTGKPAPRRMLVAGAVAVALPALSLLVYLQVGEPQIGAYPEMVSRDAPVTEEEVNRMVAQLVEQTTRNPDDGQAWLTLAVAHRAMGDAAKAARAYSRAAELLPPDAGILADQAEMTAISQGRSFAGEPEKLLRKALTLDPNHVKVNALMGATFMQSGRQVQALPHLRVLLATLDPGSDDAQKIAQLVTEIEQANPGSATAGPAPQTEPVQTGPGITGRIELAGEMPANAVLFISARAPSGPRMPYAAQRLTRPSLPMTFELTDADAMSPQRKLSDAPAVVIEARLSLSGNAIRQPGDRFGVSEPLKPGGDPVVITIDQTVP